jgi:hypothetical protein
MKIYDSESVDGILLSVERLFSTISQCELKRGVDNENQIVIYTNLFRWNDGTIRDQPDPDFIPW